MINTCPRWNALVWIISVCGEQSLSARLVARPRNACKRCHVKIIGARCRTEAIELFSPIDLKLLQIKIDEILELTHVETDKRTNF